MTRIVAGAAGGRRLVVPTGTGTRPTSERAREGLFSTLTSLVGAWAGARVLDLYAGSGAVGLEALSRGAATCLLVESDARALQALRANVDALGLPGAEPHGGRVEPLVAGGPPGPAYDIAFLDPPYDVAGDHLSAVLSDLLGHGWLAPGAVVAVERASRDQPWSWPPGFEAERSRRYGEATLWYGRAAAAYDRAGPVERAGG